MIVRMRWSRRLLAMMLGLCLTPFLLEGGLRLAAKFVPGSRAGDPGRSDILCQGDSFTFGLFLPPDAAYPARLGQLLRAGGNADTRVVNAAIPSKPTWILKQELRADLRTWKPRVVLLLAGINDHWRVRPADHAVETSGPARQPWRIVKTWHWIRNRLRGNGPEGAPDEAPAQDEALAQAEPPAPDNDVDPSLVSNWIPTSAVEQRPSVKPGVQVVRMRDRGGKLRPFEILAGAPEPEEFAAWIEEDLTTAVQIAREEGVVPVLLSYPAVSGHFEDVNRALERTAKRTGTLFIDLRPEFRQGAALVGHDALFFPDMHTTAKGTEVMARVVLGELVEHGLAEADEIPKPLQALEGWHAPELAIEALPPRGDGRAEFVEASYATGYGAVLLLSSSRGGTRVAFRRAGTVRRTTPEDPQGKLLPLAVDALLAATLKNNERATVSIQSDGTAQLPIPWDVIDALAPDATEVWAAVLVLLPKVGPIVAVSEALELRR
jgi:lysophospholipase L1-like esterase